MDPQAESITPTFSGDTRFAVRVKPSPNNDERRRERTKPLQLAALPKIELEYRGVPDSALHD